jgi:hypothetical protein
MKKVTKPKREFLYFKTVEQYHKWKGLRYFRMQPLDYEIIQVVLHAGEEKKGRGHSLGIMTLSKLTLFSNYLAMGYAMPCTKKEYDDAFMKVIGLMLE